MKGTIKFKGGVGSGNHGHGGLSGVWGGSTSGKGGGSAATKTKPANKAKLSLTGVDTASFAAALGDIVDRMSKAKINPGDFVSEVNKKFPPGKRDEYNADDVISIAKKYLQ